jgi:hypothetical protein
LVTSIETSPLVSPFGLQSDEAARVDDPVSITAPVARPVKPPTIVDASIW